MSDRLESLRKLEAKLRADVEMVLAVTVADTLAAFLAAEDARQPARAAQDAQEPVAAIAALERLDMQAAELANPGARDLEESDDARIVRRALSAYPPAPVVTDEMMRRACIAYDKTILNGIPDGRDWVSGIAMRAALEAALGGPVKRTTRRQAEQATMTTPAPTLRAEVEQALDGLQRADTMWNGGRCADWYELIRTELSRVAAENAELRVALQKALEGPVRADVLLEIANR